MNRRAARAAVLRQSLADGVKPTDIVVLGRNRLENSAVCAVNGADDFKLVETEQVARSRIPVVRFATSH